MRVVVTGGMGFIGTEVVKKFLAHGHVVVLVDYYKDLLGSYERAKLPILKDIYRNLEQCSDVLEPDEFLKEPNRGSTVVHLGACVDTRGVHEKLFEQNVDFVKRMARNLRPDSCVVFASSAATYGTEGFPCNPYGATKAMGERILTDDGTLNVTSLRFFNVYGRYEHHKGDMASMPFKMAHAYRTKSRINLFSPDASRDFISVKDVANAVFLHTMDQSRGQHRFDIGTGIATTFGDLDYMLQVLFKRGESACDTVEFPESLRGRYQFFTKAGSRGILSRHVAYLLKQDIRDSLKEQFCEKD